MKHYLRITWGVLTFALSANAAKACLPTWHPPEELQRAAEVVVVANVLSARETRTTFRSVDYEYLIDVDNIERGPFPLGRVRVTYEDLKPHRRGESLICPIKNGSNIEHDLIPQRRYRFFLKSQANPEILLAQPK